MDASLIGEFDRICGQFALALHNWEPHIYATLTVMILIGALLFPPRDDQV